MAHVEEGDPSTGDGSRRRSKIDSVVGCAPMGLRARFGIRFGYWLLLTCVVQFFAAVVVVALMFALVVGVEAVSARIRCSLLHHDPKNEIDPLGSRQAVPDLELVDASLPEEGDRSTGDGSRRRSKIESVVGCAPMRLRARFGIRFG